MCEEVDIVARLAYAVGLPPVDGLAGVQPGHAGSEVVAYIRRDECRLLLDTIESLRASLTRVEEERDALRGAATALLNTLGEAMPSIDACVTIASLHGVEYRGPALQPSVVALQDCLSRATSAEGK